MMTIKRTTKGFWTIELTAEEIKQIAKRKGFFLPLALCDHCRATPEDGIYVGVLNHWLCHDCYNKWHAQATFYPEDAPMEQKNIKHILTLLNIK